MKALKALFYIHVDCRDKINDFLHDFVFISESSARANLIRIALGRNTLNPANPLGLKLTLSLTLTLKLSPSLTLNPPLTLI